LSGSARFEHIGSVLGASAEPERDKAYSSRIGIWPSRPGEQQYGWEPPRVVGNSKHDGSSGTEERGSSFEAGKLADTEYAERWAAERRNSPVRDEWRQGTQGNAKRGFSARSQTQHSLGGDLDGSADWLDYAELCMSCDNRTDELRLLGNGVVPQTAEAAFILGMEKLGVLQ
jgi:hypothetical protein